MLLAAALAVVATAGAAVDLSPPGESPPPGALWVSPSGSDSGPGTERRPWRTLTRALSAARAGDTIVLAKGVHGARGATVDVEATGTAAHPITITSDPEGPRPRVRGYFRVTGSHLRIERIAFEGPTGRVQSRSAANPDGEDVQVAIMYGTDVVIADCEVRDNAWHAGIYVYDATKVRVLDNHIHDNGDRDNTANANLDHGIYWSKGSGRIAGNVIEDNFAYGIQLYPEPNDVTVVDNTITGNGRGGIIVARDARRIELRGNRFTAEPGPNVRKVE